MEAGFGDDGELAVVVDHGPDFVAQEVGAVGAEHGGGVPAAVGGEEGLEAHVVEAGQGAVFAVVAENGVFDLAVDGIIPAEEGLGGDHAVRQCVGHEQAEGAAVDAFEAEAVGLVESDLQGGGSARVTRTDLGRLVAVADASAVVETVPGVEIVAVLRQRILDHDLCVAHVRAVHDAEGAVVL